MCSFLQIPQQPHRNYQPGDLLCERLSKLQELSPVHSEQLLVCESHDFQGTSRGHLPHHSRKLSAICCVYVLLDFFTEMLQFL